MFYKGRFFNQSLKRKKKSVSPNEATKLLLVAFHMLNKKCMQLFLIFCYLEDDGTKLLWNSVKLNSKEQSLYVLERNLMAKVNIFWYLFICAKVL